MAKGNQQPKQPKFRKDYRASDYLIDQVTMTVDLYESHAEIYSQLHIRTNPAVPAPASSLCLDGEELALKSIAIDGQPLPASRYEQDEDSLTLHDLPAQFLLETVVHIAPQNNTRLEGLYKSGGKFCTQCEAEGFRRITFFLDRPDVLATYDVTVRAEQAKYPHLLSNGNPAGQGELDGGRHFARWLDPFPKPCYLFALVAGDFDLLADQFITTSGRKVDLKIYVDKGKLDQCAHAMASVKNSMRWDEQKYGREYDLDIYQIVAVSDFNMGAMENKGLNIFNTKYVLANRETATDTDYEGVESVIGHEYFHNWTGNRVTCRDWFQLSLKEGLTVFRDQQFSADMGSPTVKRMDDVRVMRTAQFSEDGGPMAHPIRPDSYVEMNNFYTVTVYNKGAEVIRMLHTLLGEQGFRKGMDLYFQRHDGQAVTCDDFVQAHADANAVDLTQFQRWYSQAGTPTVAVSDDFDAEKNEYHLTLKQHCAPTPGQPQKEPFLIPFRIGLLDEQGNELALDWQQGTQRSQSAVLPFAAAEQTFVFRGVSSRPLPSLLRDFSAPVKLEFGYRDEQLAFLLQHDSNLFNRWDASQTLASRVLLQLAADFRASKALTLPTILAEALRAVLRDDAVDNAVRARILQLPDIAYLQEQVEIVDIDALVAAQRFLRRQLAQSLYADLLACQQRHRGAGGTDGAAIGKRALANACLALLIDSDRSEAYALAEQQARDADNMTDRFAAVKALAHSAAPQRLMVLNAFAERFKDQALVMDKWFAVQASAPIASVLDDIRRLETHPAFDARNPNKIRALWLAFSHGNPSEFHRADGSGYQFIAERVARLNDSNPQVAARLVSCFNRWKKFDDQRQRLMLAQLKALLGKSGLSADVFEIVSKSVAA
ncbi:aminopeptidase N [Permianibacter sp. IMCC34836]|uniref:aminopeptidase N n=1 Tax=Permianibacter fluminis TaxID=2738515 RepID=UPI001557BE40|nr:aminopeptidase N [Permianibacter fluminis]NQD38079.1 aminopeptidase N [Permianibacter fluminis]